MKLYTIVLDVILKMVSTGKICFDMCFELIIYLKIFLFLADVCFFFDPLACEKKWMEFINTPSNDTQDDADDIIKFLKSMMFSLTEDSLTMAASLLETSDIWRYSTNLRSWFQDIWLHNAKVLDCVFCVSHITTMFLLLGNQVFRDKETGVLLSLLM